MGLRKVNPRKIQENAEADSTKIVVYLGMVDLRGIRFARHPFNRPWSLNFIFICIMPSFTNDCCFFSLPWQKATKETHNFLLIFYLYETNKHIFFKFNGKFSIYTYIYSKSLSRIVYVQYFLSIDAVNAYSKL